MQNQHQSNASIAHKVEEKKHNNIPRQRGRGTWCFHELLAGIWMGPAFLKSVMATCIKVKNAHKFLTKEVDFWCLSYRNNNWAEKDIHTEGFLAVWSVKNGYTRLSTSRDTWLSDTVSTEQPPVFPWRRIFVDWSVKCSGYRVTG